MYSKNLYGGKVNYYNLSRPSYPHKAVEYMLSKTTFDENSIVAELGSGTGILTEQLVKFGLRVMAIEPDPTMLDTAKNKLYSRKVHHILGSAESTGLNDKSIKSIFCGQSFHWFDHIKSRKEFKRILIEGMPVFLIWNVRKTKGNSFLENYERLLINTFPDYEKALSIDNNLSNRFSEFFRGPYVDKNVATFTQRLGLESFMARTYSCSYAHNKNHPDFSESHKKLKKLFFEHQTNSCVELAYETRVVWGALS